MPYSCTKNVQVLDLQKNLCELSLQADALRTDLGACNDYKAGPENAAKISQPALCILAGADRMTPVKFGQQMAASLANSRCEILPGAGHMLPAERPAEVNAALRRFLPA